MSAGRFLLFSLLSEEDVDKRRANFHILQTSGVQEDWFFLHEERSTYRRVCEYFLAFGVVPSTALIEAEGLMSFPSYRIYEPFEYFLGLFKEYYRETVIEETLAQIQEHHNNDEGAVRDEKLFALVSKLDDLSSISKSTRLLSEVTRENLEKHRELQRQAGDSGVKFGIPYLDGVTGGAQKGDLWVIAGNSGSGKSFITCRMAMGAVMGRNPEDAFTDLAREDAPELGVLYDVGAIVPTEIVTWPKKRVLFISMEMTNSQIGLRDASLGAKVNGMNFRLGRLPDLSVQMIERFLHRWQEWELDDKLILVEGSVTMSVKDVLHKIKEHKPDVVFIDGAYMLRLDGKSSSHARWEVIMNNVEILKKAAMAENIPIIATFQFDQKAKEKKLESIMGGQAIGQIASVAIGLEDDSEGSQSNASNVQFKQMTLLKGRNGEQGKIKLRFDMDKSVIKQVSGEGSGLDYDESTVDDIVEISTIPSREPETQPEPEPTPL